MTAGRALPLIPTAAAPAALLLAPLIIAPGLLFHYDVTPKIAVLLLAAAAALPWLVWPSRRLVLVAAAQALSLIASAAFSRWPLLSITGGNWRQYGVLTQLAVMLLAVAAASGPPVRVYLRAMVCAGIPVALYGIAQYSGWDPWLPKQAYHIGDAAALIVRPPGTLGHATYFANYLVFVVFYGVALASAERGTRWAKAGAAAAALAALAIVLSGTRAAVLAVLVGGLFLWLWHGRRVRMRVVVMAGAAVLAAGAAFYWSPAGRLLRNRVRWSIEDATGGARPRLWVDSLRLAGRHPVLGTGPEKFTAEFPAVESKALARAYPDFYYESPHNLFLDALTAQGALGLLALAGWLGLGYGAAWPARARSTEPTGSLAAALTGAVVCHQFSVLVAPTAFCLYLTVVLLLPREARTISARRRWTVYAWLPLSAVFCVFAVRLVTADWLLCGTDVLLTQADPNRAVAVYRAARAWGAKEDLWFSRRISDYSAAPTLYREAVEAGILATKSGEEPANAWYNLASLFARANDVPRTEAALRSAIEASPNWYKPHWTLARVLWSAGHRDEALAQAAAALDLNGGRNAEVSQTLAALRR